MNKLQLDYSLQGKFSEPFVEVMAKLVRRLDVRKLTLANLSDQLIKEIRNCEIVSSHSGFPKQEINDAMFAVCSWCDEQIMNAEWGGVSEYWADHLLQRRFFNTTLAGERFYDNLERLRQSGGLALAVYAFCLFNGFKGKYVYDLHLEDLERTRADTVNATFNALELDRRDTQTFPTLSDLGDSLYLPWKTTKGLWVTFAILLFFAFLSSTLAGIVNTYVERIIRVW